MNNISPRDILSDLTGDTSLAGDILRTLELHGFKIVDSKVASPPTGETAHNEPVGHALSAETKSGYCCSAASPCSHQKRNPSSICDVSARATTAQPSTGD
jgi:hypothetical protein